MATRKNPPVEPAADRVVATSRVLSAPREAVFSAFADPAQLARWWGPRHFSNTIGEFDFRPGGAWQVIMHAPDGTNYPNHWICRDIETPSRIVLDHPDPDHAFELAITLTEHGAGTRLTWRMTFAKAEECVRVRALVTGANEETLDRLATVLAQTSSPDNS